MLGLLAALFTLYLTQVLLTRRRPKDHERRLSLLSFCLLIPTLVLQGLPLGVVSLLSVLMTAYLQRAR